MDRPASGSGSGTIRGVPHSLQPHVCRMIRGWIVAISMSSPVNAQITGFPGVPNKGTIFLSVASFRLRQYLQGRYREWINVAVSVDER